MTGLPSDQDLQFAISPEIDVGAVEKALSRIEQLSQKAGISSAKALEKGLASSGITAEMLRRREELEKLNATTVERAKLESKVGEELDHQLKLEQLKAQLDPQNIENLVRRQKELNEVNQQLEESLDKERQRQGLGGSQPSQGEAGQQEQQKLDIGQILQQVSSGGLMAGISSILSQLDMPQLLAGMFGAYSASGVKGGLGATVGGMVGQAATGVEPVTPVGEAPFVLEVPEMPAERGRDSAPTDFAREGTGNEFTGKIGGQAAGQVAGATMGGGIEAGAGAAAGIGMEAAMGPIGLAVEAAKATAKVAGQLYSLPFKGINAGLSLVEDGLRDLQGPIGPIGAGLNVVTKGLDSLAAAIEEVPLIGDVLGPMLRQLGMVPGAIKSITETLTSFTALAAPGQYRMFQMALEDTQAVLGHTFLPALNLMREAVILVGDAFASFLPNSAEMEDALAGVKGTLGEMAAQLREAFGELGPEIRRNVVQVVQLAGQVFSRFADMMMRFREPITDLIRAGSDLAEAFIRLQGPILSLGLDAVELALTGLATLAQWAANGLMMVADALRALGLISEDTAPGSPRSQVGAAARPAHFNSIQGYQDQLQQAAFSQSGALTERDLPMITNNMLNTLNRIRDILDGWSLDSIAGEIGGAVGRAIGEILPSARPALAGAAAAVDTIAGPGTVAGAGAGLPNWLRQQLGL